MTQPSAKLIKLGTIALKAKLAADAAQEVADSAKLAFMQQLIAEDMFNPDTKAIGPVKTGISPNRYFDVDTAISLLKPEVVESCKVLAVDPALLKENMTPKQKEAAMKSYDVPYKLGLKVNE
jgi:hypothetical protein